MGMPRCGHAIREPLQCHDCAIYLLGCAEREVRDLMNAKENCKHQAIQWAQEARTQRSTVHEVGRILGGVPCWGPIAESVEGLVDAISEAIDALDPITCGDAEHNPAANHAGSILRAALAAAEEGE